METLTLENGNHQSYTIELPKVVIIGGDKWNETAIYHIFTETGLNFTTRYTGSIEVQPQTSQQIVKLLLTYNFKTQYHNNATNHNTLFLKSDHHVGFQVDSICYDCAKENHIVSNGLEQGNRLAC
jgi:hypothetical protein